MLKAYLEQGKNKEPYGVKSDRTTYNSTSHVWGLFTRDSSLPPLMFLLDET